MERARSHDAAEAPSLSRLVIKVGPREQQHGVMAGALLLSVAGRRGDRLHALPLRLLVQPAELLCCPSGRRDQTSAVELLDRPAQLHVYLHVIHPFEALIVCKSIVV